METNIKKQRISPHCYSEKILMAIRRNYTGWLLFLPTIFLIYVVFWNPIFIGFVFSLFEMKGFSPVSFVGFQNYIDVLSDAEFIKTLLNSLSYVFWSLIIGFLLPIIISIMLNEVRYGKSFFKFSVYFPSLLPSVAVALMWSFMFEPGEGGVLNMLLSKINITPSQWLQNSELTIPLIVSTMTWKGFGATTLIYLASLQSINNEHYEAAALDGAGVFSKLRYITIPHMHGIMLLMFVQQIISVFQVMSEPLMMTDGGPSNASLSLNLQSYFYAFRYMKVDKALALGVITFLFLFVLTIFYYRTQKRVESNLY